MLRRVSGGALVAGGLLAAALAACGSVEPESPQSAPAPLAIDDTREPCAARDPLRQAFFGETHVHTGFSFDARVRDVRTTPDDAYRYARGDELRLPPLGGAELGTRPVRLSRALDFAAVTDHSETMGETWLCTHPDSASYDSAPCRSFRGEGLRSVLLRLLTPKAYHPHLGLFSFLPFLTAVEPKRLAEVCGKDSARCEEAAASVWRAEQLAAERAYDRSRRCRFTSFVAYEYTASPRGNNLHRNVIFRNASVPALPISAVEAPRPEQLYRALRAQCLDAGTGCDALAIPHNPNWSGGQMFWTELPELETREARAAWARERAGFEPVAEIYQHKGDSECRNGLPGVGGAPDELCDFEKLRPPDQPQEDCGAGYDPEGGGSFLDSCLSQRDFLRHALVEGLRMQAEVGVNPFELGIIAATDSHDGTPGAVDEKSFHGGFGAADATPAARVALRGHSAGGLAGAWAEENSRDAIFDAFRRRETFGTSGPRIVPRFFGGWALAPDLCGARDFAARGYAQGVPMGGTLPPRPRSAGAPRFALSALRDPEGNPLERLQIVKGWIGDDGRSWQAVYDVAGRAGASELDLASCEIRGGGVDAACSVWSDPDFDPSRSAVYYARVVEVPSCRFSTWQCNALPVDERPEICAAPPADAAIQERAWTSPIWYTAPRH